MLECFFTDFFVTMVVMVSLSVTGIFNTGINLLSFTEHNLGEFSWGKLAIYLNLLPLRQTLGLEVNSTSWWFPLSSSRTQRCLFILISVPIQMKLQSLCDMATVPRTSPLGVAEVPLCCHPFLAFVCIPNAWQSRRFPGFGFLWLSMPSSLSRLSKSLLSLQSEEGQ